jgi:hypothetical protein
MGVTAAGSPGRTAAARPRPAVRPAFAVLVIVLVAALLGAMQAPAVVRLAAGVSTAAEALVTRAGGTVGRQLGIIDGVAADQLKRLGWTWSGWTWAGWTWSGWTWSSRRRY